LSPFVRGEAEGRGVYGLLYYLSINPPVLPHHPSFTKEDRYGIFIYYSIVMVFYYHPRNKNFASENRNQYFMTEAE